MQSSSNNGGGEKPVIVRVKRKLNQSPLEALWIEINDRPAKRPLLDFQNLSINPSSSSSPPLEEPKQKRVLVQHIETVGRSEDAIDIVSSYVEEASPDIDDDPDFKFSSKQTRRSTLRTPSIHNRILSKARQQQQELAKTARFEQIWKRRTHDNECVHDEALGEVCRVYDILRVDTEETSATQEKQDEMSVEDQEALSKFLPLLRECIPTAAEDIESDFSFQASKRDSTDGYVYDLYAIKEKIDEEEASYPFPLVQLEDDDQYYEGPDNSDYESDDSNAENHPWNDYPEEEESSEDEEKTDTSDSEKSEEDESEDDTGSEVCLKRWSDYMVSEDHVYDEMDENRIDDLIDVDADDDDDDEDWR